MSTIADIEARVKACYVPQTIEELTRDKFAAALADLRTLLDML